MIFDQEATDGALRYEIVLSCQAIKTHASFVGVSAEKIARMPESVAPMVMDELNEAAGVLQRALGRIDKAKELLLSKTLQAAE